MSASNDKSAAVMDLTSPTAVAGANQMDDWIQSEIAKAVAQDSAQAAADAPMTGVDDGADELSMDSWIADRIITVLVGAEQVRWNVHVKLLTGKSPYFAEIFENPIDGHKVHEVRLMDTEPKLFNMMLRWLYSTAFAQSGGPRVFRFEIPDGSKYTVRDL